VAKSNRQRKQDRTRRQAAAARRKAVAERRRLLDSVVREVEQRLARVYDPQTPADELATLLAEQYAGDPVPPGMVALLHDKGHSIRKLHEVAAAVDAARRGSLTALTFAASVAHLVGDHTKARRQIDAALDAADDRGDVEGVTRHLLFHGRVADAIELAQARLRKSPDDRAAAETYALAIEDAHGNLAARDPRPCPCASGRDWAACCAPRERAALDQFADRGGLYELRAAMTEWVQTSPYADPVANHVAEWWDDDADVGEPRARALSLMAVEHALLLAHRDPDADDDADNPLTAFADDPRTAPELARRARDWRGHVHYGLWRVEDLAASPGVWCTEIVAGITRYVAFAPEQIERLARWSVLLTAVVPVDGVWRATGAAMQLSPTEADGLCELVLSAIEAVAREVTGDRRRRTTDRPAPFGQAEPHTVLAGLSDECDEGTAHLVNLVTGIMLPRLAKEIRSVRLQVPQLTNTDGNRLCLLRARIKVHDGAAVTSRLQGHRDFTPTDDPGELTWWGKTIPAAQQAAMRAEVLASLQAEGGDPDLVTDPPQRWVRGSLRCSGDELQVEVNSRERLARLLDVLREVGGDPVVVDEWRVDPEQDLPWPPAPSLASAVPRRSAVPAGESWERHWLDEPVPALLGRTPRQAAAGPERPRLETLLREFEYHAEANGRSAPEVDWLREQLDMPADGW